MTKTAATGSWLQTAAYLIIVIAGLRVAAPLVLPILVAAILAIALQWPLRALTRRGVPMGLAMTGVGGLLVVVSTVLTQPVVRSISQFRQNAPAYLERLKAKIEPLVTWAESTLGTAPEPDLLLQPDSVMRAVTATAEGAVNLLSSMFVIALITVFMLFEAQSLPAKLARAIDPEKRAALGEVVDRVNQYLSLKTAVSVVTGVCAGVLTAALGVDFPILWGVLAFVCNYVPTIGSVVAALPPVALAVVQGDSWTLPLLTATGYLLINVVIGNVLEPRLMGRRMGLSTLVVFLSLLFWGWVLGPIGMLLSIPLTMTTKIALEHSTRYSVIAVLLGPPPPDTDPAARS